MTQEDKELLLRDLCARLPYGVKLDTPDGLDTLGNIDTNEGWINASYDVDEVKPYLRPMSSMTHEEIVEINSMGFAYWTTMINNDLRTRGSMSLLDAIITHHKMVKLIDWLNVHHFDYRGFIEKGLALEAPEGMYNIKEK